MVTGMPWGDVGAIPLWILAASSLGAMAIAGAAVRVLARAQRLDAQRFAVIEAWYLHHLENSSREQAAHVCAWPVSERETFQKVIERGVVGAAVRNASQAPVYDVEIVYRDPDAAWMSIKRIPAIPPSDEPQVYPGFDEESTEGLPKPERVNDDGSISLAPSARMRVEIRFRDGHGRRWTRDDRGDLTLTPAPDSA